MLSSRPVRLALLLKVQAGSAAQTLAQVSALKKQMPLLYVMVLINSATVAYTTSQSRHTHSCSCRC